MERDTLVFDGPFEGVESLDFAARGSRGVTVVAVQLQLCDGPFGFLSMAIILRFSARPSLIKTTSLVDNTSLPRAFPSLDDSLDSTDSSTDSLTSHIIVLEFCQFLELWEGVPPRSQLSLSPRLRS